MLDQDCIHFLQWSLPQMQMRWSGFRRVRKQVCKRLARHLMALELDDLACYRQYLNHNTDEWQKLDSLCRVVVTRFYRDKRVFGELVERVLPQLAAKAQATGRETLHAWSIGSASGEEAYTLAILWYHLLAPHYPGLRLTTVGTEIDAHLLERSHHACYPGGTIKNLPEALRHAAFVPGNGNYCLQSRYQAMVSFLRQDIRTELPDGKFDLILCRNLVFTYFDKALQLATLERIMTRLRPGGWLLLGVHESLPADTSGLKMIPERPGLYHHE